MMKVKLIYKIRLLHLKKGLTEEIKQEEHAWSCSNGRVSAREVDGPGFESRSSQNFFSFQFLIFKKLKVIGLALSLFFV